MTREQIIKKNAEKLQQYVGLTVEVEVTTTRCDTYWYISTNRIINVL